MNSAHPPIIGLLDSGLPAAVEPPPLAAQAFVLEDEVRLAPAVPDPAGHGTAMHGLIREAAPVLPLLNAQVFGAELRTTPLQVAVALDWLVEKGAKVISLSFGLGADRSPLRQSVERALNAHCWLIAASPARGDPVWPAAYEGVLRVSGDARLKPGEISLLDSPQADIGACAFGPAGQPLGASAAAARMTGMAAAWLDQNTTDDTDDTNDTNDRAAFMAWLEQRALYHGPERKT